MYVHLVIFSETALLNTIDTGIIIIRDKIKINKQHNFLCKATIIKVSLHTGALRAATAVSQSLSAS